MRIEDHPILGPPSETQTVSFDFEGTAVIARIDDTIASALVNAGEKVFRRTHRKRQPRGVFCGIGHCTDCVMIVDGQPNIRTCVTPVRDGMIVKRQIGLGKWDKEL